jgi:hypothetical protein
MCADRPGPSGGPSATPRWASGRNYKNHITSTTDCLKEKKVPFETKRGPSGPKAWTVRPLESRETQRCRV